MSGSSVIKSFTVGDKCYWTVSAVNLTTWQSAVRLCDKTRGDLTVIKSVAENNQIASNLDRFVV